jgi:hypothetical protein
VGQANRRGRQANFQVSLPFERLWVHQPLFARYSWSNMGDGTEIGLMPVPV